MPEYLRRLSESLAALIVCLTLLATSSIEQLHAQRPTNAMLSLQALADRLTPAFPHRLCREERESVIESMVRRCYLQRAAGAADTLELLFEQHDSLTGVYWQNRRFDDEAAADRFVDSLALELAGAQLTRWRCPPDTGNGFAIRTHAWTGSDISVILKLSRRERESWRLYVSFLLDPSSSAREDFCPLGEKLPASPALRRGLVAAPDAPGRKHGYGYVHKLLRIRDALSNERDPHTEP
jgi:hypothetical protein